MERGDKLEGQPNRRIEPLHTHGYAAAEYSWGNEATTEKAVNT